jgi:glycosyltransferase involved in cell wall biosynthesis
MIVRKHSDKIALVCDYLPRKCGIATFSSDVRHSIVGQYPDVECMVVPISDVPESYDYPPEVRFEIAESDAKSYQRAADFINFSDAEVVSLQHEYGIFGGTAGSHVLTLLRELRVPVVTHLHTILEEPKPAQRRVMEEIVRRSARLIVMTERGRRMIQDIYGASPDRIDLIPHGIPDMPFVDPNFYKDQFGVEGRKVLLTFGLITPNKGIEYMIRALPEIVARVPEVVYVVLGTTHPAVLRSEGETYRLMLERLIESLGLTKHVVFYNRFVGSEELKEFLGAADLYVTPYLTREQITSGALAYAFGCGKVVVSTPYWHAEELLADGRGVLVPFRDSAALAREITELLENEGRRHAMRKQAYLLGREMIWSNVAHQFMESFHRARLGPANKRLALKTLEQQHYQLPELQLAHLERLSDHVGIFHNATHVVPDYARGYRTIDNALALRLTILLEETGDADARTHGLATIYAGFLNHAFDLENGRFHSHLSFDRTWPDPTETDDALAAGVWALGTCVGRSPAPGLQRWAAQLMNRALPALGSTESPRAWALGLLGIHEYLRRLSGDRVADQMRELLTKRLVELFRANTTDDCPWFETEIGHSSAWHPHALILSGRWSNQHDVMEIGLRSLRWFMRTQTKSDRFRAITAARTKEPVAFPAQFNQMPMEACAAVAACIEAFAASQDASWQKEARKAFEWFLGRNDLGESLYDPTTGGCCDALHVDRRNLNQGAESTLAFLLSLQEMRLYENAIQAFDQVTSDSAIEARPRLSAEPKTTEITASA